MAEGLIIGGFFTTILANWKILACVAIAIVVAGGILMIASASLSIGTVAVTALAGMVGVIVGLWWQGGENGGPAPPGPPPPPPTPNNVLISIQFVPTEQDPSKAKYFSCNIRVGEHIKMVRANDMKQFESDVRHSLAKAKADVNVKTANKPDAVIHIPPDPGKNVLEKLEQLIKDEMPGVAVRVEDRTQQPDTR